jgi:ubiquinone/menaquinone biosynthesis C-methylase UbiE
MLQPYLNQYADHVDEKNYRVILRGNLQYEANKTFHDGGYFSQPWFVDVWQHYFRQKIERSGLSIPRGGLILDICCGSGYLGEFVAKEFGARVICCDLSQSQLYHLRRRISDSLRGQLSECVADVLRLPFKREAFDIVLGNSFLHHLPDVLAALSELRPLIKQGGHLVVLHEPSERSAFWESFPLSVVKDTTMRDGNFTDLWMFQPQELVDLVRSAGFHRARVMGTGIIGSLLVNWYLILALKFNLTSKKVVYPAYRFRDWLNYLDLGFNTAFKLNQSPSLLLVAQT